MASGGIQTGGRLKQQVTITEGLPKGAFGELMTATLTPFIQNVACYNLIPSNFREYTASGGSTGAVDGLWYCTTGTTVGGYGAIQSFRTLTYNAGQGGRFKFTAIYGTPTEGTWQGAGAVSIKDELSFGYNGTEFGLWHRYHGKVEVRTIQVTVAAGGSETLTLTLNSVAYSIPLTSGTVQHNAYEIAAWLNANQTVWVAEQVNDTVIISANSDGAKSGTYSYSSATSTATLTQRTAGVTKTSDFVAQADWNVDTLSGWSTPFNPQKGNVYRIKYQYLGFGDIFFEVEDPEIGDFVTVHKIKYPNKYTQTSLSNPSMRFGFYAVNTTSTTSVTIQCASTSAFIEGTPVKTRNPRSEKKTQTITTAAFTNILTIKNARTYNYLLNQVEIQPLQLSIANEGAKNIEVEVRSNPTLSGETNYQSVGTKLVSLKETTANTVSGGTLLTSYTVSGGQNQVFDLTKLDISAPPTLQISISAKLNSGSSAPVTATLTWYEDL